MATRYDLVCEQGVDLSFTVTYYRGETNIPVDVTGGTARLQARSGIRATLPFLDIDSDTKGGIAVGGDDGVFTIFVAADATKHLPITSEAVYDMEFVDSAGKVSRVLEGRFKVKGEVTR
jgi:hypothetical protein